MVTGACLAEAGHNVICADIDEEKIQELQQGNLPIYEEGLEELVQEMQSLERLSFTTSTPEAVAESRIIYITVGTPATKSGEPDLSAVEAVARDIAGCLGDEYRVIVEKSTVPVNTGEQVESTVERYSDPGASFDIVSNPEFLSEGTALRDARNPHRIVVGVSSDRSEELMRSVYEPFDAPLIVTDVSSAELIKHASNSFLALKISYINAISRICELSGANVEEVSRGMGMDPRIGNQFLNAGIGYGGSCFPKDVDAFYKISDNLGYDFRILQEVQKINREQRELILNKIEDELWILNDKKIAVLGLSFKPGTDDIRESPALYVIEDLLEENCNISAYDPRAIENARRVLPEDVDFAETPVDAATDADCLLVVTDWPEFEELDYDEIQNRMTHPLLVDGRNMLDPDEMRKRGFTYHSVGRP